MFLQSLKLLINLSCLHARKLSKDTKTLGKGYQRVNLEKLFGFNEALTPSSCCNINEWLRERVYIAWERVLPYYFIFNKMNYARYGSYYVQVLKQIESKYPGLKELLFALWIICSSPRNTPSANYNRPTGWANYKQGCKNFRYVNGVLITQFSWRKEIFCL